jgi:hypothetical protein
MNRTATPSSIKARALRYGRNREIKAGDMANSTNRIIPKSVNAFPADETMEIK